VKELSHNEYLQACTSCLEVVLVVVALFNENIIESTASLFSKTPYIKANRRANGKCGRGTR
jgi:hypothetical protein